MWKQRSKVLWLIEGNKNSKIFHTKASNQRRQNRLVSLHDEEGVWLLDSLLDVHIIEYFKVMFSTNIEKEPIDFLSAESHG